MNKYVLIYKIDCSLTSSMKLKSWQTGMKNKNINYSNFLILSNDEFQG
jgi:hypothetical protein